MSAETTIEPEAGDPRGESDVAKGGAQMFAYRVIELAAQGLMIVVTARLLQPEGRGLYALAALTAMLCVLPLGSIWVANAHEHSQGRATAQELLGASVVVAIVGGALTGVVALAVAPFLGDRWWVVAFPAAITPFLLFTQLGYGLFVMLGHIHAVGLVTLARVVLPLVFISVPLFAGAGDRTAIGVWTLSLIVIVALMYPALRRAAGGQRRPHDRALYGRLVRYGLRLSPAMAAVVGTSRFGLVVLAALVSTAAVGVYSVAIAASEVLYLTSYALQASAFRRIGSGAHETSVNLSVRALRHAVLLALVGGVAVVPVSLVALPVIVGDGYEDVPLLLAVLVPGIVAQAGSMTLSTFFSVKAGKPMIVTTATLIMAGLSIVLAIPATLAIGIWGAALAATVANILGALLITIAFRRETGVPLRSLRPGVGELVDYRELAQSMLRRARPGNAV